MGFIDDANKWLADRALAEYVDKGYSLQKYEDWTIVLMYKGKQVAAWPQHGVTQQDIYNACQRHEQRLIAALAE